MTEPFDRKGRRLKCRSHIELTSMMRRPMCSTPVETHVFFRSPESGILVRAEVKSADGDVYALKIPRDVEKRKSQSSKRAKRQRRPHVLRKMTSLFRPMDSYTCSICGGPRNVWVYRCHGGNSDVHPWCAGAVSKNEILIHTSSMPATDDWRAEAHETTELLLRTSGIEVNTTDNDHFNGQSVLIRAF